MFCACTVGLVVLVVAYYVIDLVFRSLKVGKIMDKHVLITGCDSGFGKLAALRLDKLGFHVFAACLTKDGASSLSETCSNRLTTLILDVGSTESIEEAVQFVQGKLPSDTGLWALINNAGIAGPMAPSEFCSREDIQKVLNVNLLGVIDITRHFLPLIRKCSGRVVNTSSVVARLAIIGAAYTASKFGVEGFSDILRHEMRHHGVKVLIVEPGAFNTSIFNMDKILADCQAQFDRESPEVQAAYGGEDLIKKIREATTNFVRVVSHDIGPVVDAYIHAITSKFPRTRYVVGTDAKLFYIPMSYLPASVADFILDRLM